VLPVLVELLIEKVASIPIPSFPSPVRRKPRRRQIQGHVAICL